MTAIKGRTLKLRDAADVQKQIEKVMKKTVKGCNVGNIFQAEGFAQIENDGKFASELSVELEKIPGIKIISIFDHVGEYDWKSDTYIRPSKTVYNKFARKIHDL